MQTALTRLAGMLTRHSCSAAAPATEGAGLPPHGALSTGSTPGASCSPGRGRGAVPLTSTATCGEVTSRTPSTAGLADPGIASGRAGRSGGGQARGADCGQGAPPHHHCRRQRQAVSKAMKDRPVLRLRIWTRVSLMREISAAFQHGVSGEVVGNLPRRSSPMAPSAGATRNSLRSNITRERLRARTNAEPPITNLRCRHRVYRQYRFHLPVT